MYKGYLIDLDGTVYRGKEPIPAAKIFIEKLQKKQLPFLFLTNNTTKTPETVQKNLSENFDIHVPSSTIFTAANATVDYMNHRNKGRSVYVVGAPGLVELILNSGFQWEESNPDYVVVGLDPGINYEKMTIATLAIQKGAHFIGTNPDKNIPTERGLLPGAGSLVTFFETSTGVKPTIIGKPETAIMDSAIERLGLSKKEVLMVGDNYLTDIQAGIRNGIDTLLVLSGFTQKEEVPKLPIAPTYVLDSLADWSAI